MLRQLVEGVIAEQQAGRAVGAPLVAERVGRHCPQHGALLDTVDLIVNQHRLAVAVDFQVAPLAARRACCWVERLKRQNCTARPSRCAK